MLREVYDDLTDNWKFELELARLIKLEAATTMTMLYLYLNYMEVAHKRTLVTDDVYYDLCDNIVVRWDSIPAEIRRWVKLSDLKDYRCTLVLAVGRETKALQGKNYPKQLDKTLEPYIQSLSRSASSERWEIIEGAN